MYNVLNILYHNIELNTGIEDGIGILVYILG